MRAIEKDTLVMRVKDRRIGKVLRVFALHRMYRVDFGNEIINIEAVDIIYYMGDKGIGDIA